MAKYSFPLTHREEIADGTMAYQFDTSGSDFIFTPGQNADFTLTDPPETDDRGNTRTFSFASSPSEKQLLVATRKGKSAFKNSLNKIPIGTRIAMDGPLGSFTLHKNHEKPAILLAGGIGITPFRSIAAFAAEEQLPHHLYLFCANRSPRSTAFLSDLVAFEKKNPRFHVHPTVDDAGDEEWKYDTGYIDEAKIKKHVPAEHLKSAIYYMAGPPAMVAAMRTMLDTFGVSEDDIRFEEFSGY